MVSRASTLETLRSTPKRADGEQVVSVVQNTDAKGADAVRGTEHLHVHGLAAVRARDGFRTTKESDGV